jgi:pyruvate formate lyase activating enzyme
VACANYGQLTSIALDPIEKKPLAYYLPGSKVLSVGSFGCNLNCAFCQNSSIARMRCGDASIPTDTILPAELVQMATKQVGQGNIGLAYTYNEPLVGYEFVLDCARLIRQAGLKNILVSNGYINDQPWAELLPWLDAANIDLKAFDQGFYDRLGAPQGLDTVKRSIAMAAPLTHLEVTTLVIPGWNDSAAQIDELAQWLANLSTDITLHLTRFFPSYRLRNVSATPIATLYELADIASQSLRQVVLGNV